jgi:DNA-binding transcriptional ArsR family regulator
MDINAALSAFEALSQETRLTALRLLVTAGPAGMPAGMIAERLECRQNTMSSHLQSLRRAGLVDATRHGRSIRYSANYQGVRALIQFLLEDCCADDACTPDPKENSI